jgi:hypothetical protein
MNKKIDKIEVDQSQASFDHGSPGADFSGANIENLNIIIYNIFTILDKNSSSNFFADVLSVFVRYVFFGIWLVLLLIPIFEGAKIEVVTDMQYRASIAVALFFGNLSFLFFSEKIYRKINKSTN